MFHWVIFRRRSCKCQFYLCDYQSNRKGIHEQTCRSQVLIHIIKYVSVQIWRQIRVRATTRRADGQEFDSRSSCQIQSCFFQVRLHTQFRVSVLYTRLLRKTYRYCICIRLSLAYRLTNKQTKKVLWFDCDWLIEMVFPYSEPCTKTYLLGRRFYLKWH